MEGAEAAAEEWREQQQELLKQVAQLEAQLAGLQGSRGGHKGRDASDASSSLKSELDSLKSEMRADLHSSLKAIEERWQERHGLPVAVAPCSMLRMSFTPASWPASQNSTPLSPRDCRAAAGPGEPQQGGRGGRQQAAPADHAAGGHGDPLVGDAVFVRTQWNHRHTLLLPPNLLQYPGTFVVPPSHLLIRCAAVTHAANGLQLACCRQLL